MRSMYRSTIIATLVTECYLGRQMIVHERKFRRRILMEVMVGKD